MMKIGDKKKTFSLLFSSVSLRESSREVRNQLSYHNENSVTFHLLTTNEVKTRLPKTSAFQQLFE